MPILRLPLLNIPATRRSTLEIILNKSPLVSILVAGLILRSCCVVEYMLWRACVLCHELVETLLLVRRDIVVVDVLRLPSRLVVGKVAGMLRWHRRSRSRLVVLLLLYGLGSILSLRAILLILRLLLSLSLRLCHAYVTQHHIA